MSKNIVPKNKKNSREIAPLMYYLIKRPNLVRNTVTAHAILLFGIHIILQLVHNKKPVAVSQITDPVQVFTNFQVVMKQALSIVPPQLMNKIPKVPNMWTPPQPQPPTSLIESVVRKETLDTFMSQSALFHGSSWYRFLETFSTQHTQLEHMSELYGVCVTFVSSMFRDIKLHNQGKGENPMIRMFTQFMSLKSPQIRNRELLFAVLHFIGLLAAITQTWKSFFDTGGISRFEYFYKYFTYLAVFRMIMGVYKPKLMNKRNKNKTNRMAINRKKLLLMNNKKSNNKNNRSRRNLVVT